MRTTVRRRFIILIFSVCALLGAGWLEIYLQRQQHIIGAGINRSFLFLLINVHLVISIILLYLIIRQSIKLIIERKKEIPGSAFKRNLFLAFLVFSVIPVVFVFFIAGKLITTSIDNWFDVRLGSGLENSLYLHKEQTKEVRLALASAGEKIAREIETDMQKKRAFVKDELAKSIVSMKEEQPEFEQYKVYLWKKKGGALLGSIRDEVRVWRSFRKVNDRSTHSLRQSFMFELQKSCNHDYQFDFYGSLYWAHNIVLSAKDSCVLLVVHRYPEYIRYPLIEIQNSICDYQQLKSMRHPIYWSYLLAFLLITLLILFLSIWCAMYLARGISKPIQDLLLAIDRIRKGDWNVKVEYQETDDLRHLVIGFNEMTSTLQRAYKQLEFHNNEMLTMLEHVKESVFFINNYGRILTFNDAAKRLIEKYLHIKRFKRQRISFFGSYVKDSFFLLVRELHASEKLHLTREISFTHDGEAKTFMVYVTVIQNELVVQNNGVLVVIEDLSDVYKINKIKTWQEAAKQMAHEVKNPLTPIQLATQRLQRKLRKQEHQDPVLMECADTILHQVRIIKDLVSHFSEFAKMPGTIVKPLDINKIIKEVGALYEMSYPDISFSYELYNFLPALKADQKKLKRVMVNLLDNSVRVLESQSERNISIKTGFKTSRNQIELIIADNGPGIPCDVSERLFLPYVSSSSKNMGLGLAIVHDIIRQSGGSVKLLSTGQGATFQILLPV